MLHFITLQYEDEFVSILQNICSLVVRRESSLCK